MPSMFSEPERLAATRLIELALVEDLADAGDLTAQALIAEEDRAEVRVVARQAGILAGVPVAEMVFQRLDPRVDWRPRVEDGAALAPGMTVAVVAGPLRSLLTGERTALNVLAHLSGVATLTRRFVDAVTGTKARIFDTRKTLPGWRVLQKYAVRAGGGSNHRMGLYDGCLIKDNHLAAWIESGGPDAETGRRGDGERSIADRHLSKARQAGKPDLRVPRERSIAEAVRESRARIPTGMPVEVEVDTLEQLADALCGSPDVVLLDNMDAAALCRAVELRDATAPGIELEASGGIQLDNVREIAQTGVERISVGALTHSAAALDLAFDWLSGKGDCDPDVAAESPRDDKI